MAVENKQPPQPEVNDQNTGGDDSYQRAETQATERMREDTRSTTNGTGNGNDNDNGTEGTSLTATDNPTDGGTEGESAVDQMLREVEDAYKAASKVAASLSKMFSAGLSPETAAKFGTPQMFDSANGEDGGEAAASRIEAATAEAQQEEAETEDAPEETEDAGEGNGDPAESGSMIGDAFDWAKNTFNDYVVQPASEMLSDVTEFFGGDWSFEGTKAPDEIAGINNVSNRDFNQETNQAMRNFNFNLEGAQDQQSGQGLEMPDNAVLAGSAQIGNSEVQVYRTPEGDTYLKKGDQVIARQKPDGSYGVSLRDGSNLDFKLEKGEDGKYNLESLERTKNGQLQQKYSDGVFYNYNYDSQGNRTSVDAAADIDGPLSQERLDKIRAELGDNGSAALRVNQDGKSERLLLQTHGKDTHSLTNIDTKRAQIFNNGQEYRLNEHDRLERVDKDGNANDEDPSNAADEAERKERERVRDLIQRVNRRASGDSEEAVDGVKVHVDPDTGNARFEREDPETGETQTTTEMPADSEQPISITNQNGERIQIDGPNLKIDAPDGKPLFDFNENTGLETDTIKVDDAGLVDKETGTKLDPDGNVLDANGDFIGGPAEEFWSDMPAENCPHEEHRENVAETADEIKDLGVKSLGFSVTNVTAAIQLAREALGKAGPYANDPMVQLAMSTPITALNRAERNEDIRDNAPKLAEAHVGAFDTMTVDQYMRSYQMANSPLSPRDFIRSQAKSRFPESNVA